MQLLQDDAYVRAVLCVGAGLWGARVGWTLSDSGCLIQNGEEGQMITILPSILFILFSLCSNFTQDLGLFYKGNTDFPTELSHCRKGNFSKINRQHCFLPVSASVLVLLSTDMPVLKPRDRVPNTCCNSIWHKVRLHTTCALIVHLH